MQNWDLELLYAINQAGTPSWDVFWQIISNTWVWIPIYLWFFWRAYKTLDWRSLILFIAMVVLLITVSDQMAFYVKETLTIRQRPCHIAEIAQNLRLIDGICRGGFGYYSAHASNHAALGVMVLLSFRFNWVATLVILLWVALIGISRVYLGVHFPTDVLTGWFVGSVMAFFFATLFRIVWKKEFW